MICFCLFHYLVHFNCNAIMLYAIIYWGTACTRCCFFYHILHRHSQSPELLFCCSLHIALLHENHVRNVYREPQFSTLFYDVFPEDLNADVTQSFSSCNFDPKSESFGLLSIVIHATEHDWMLTAQLYHAELLCGCICIYSVSLLTYSGHPSICRKKNSG